LLCPGFDFVGECNGAHSCYFKTPVARSIRIYTLAPILSRRRRLFRKRITRRNWRHQRPLPTYPVLKLDGEHAVTLLSSPTSGLILGIKFNLTPFSTDLLGLGKGRVGLHQRGNYHMCVFNGSAYTPCNKVDPSRDSAQDCQTSGSNETAIRKPTLPLRRLCQ
jgi:hypothetical protein